MRFIAFFLLMMTMITAEVQGPRDGMALRVSYKDAVHQTAPAVVNIFTEKRVVGGGFGLFMEDPFYQMFFDDAFTPAPMRERVERSLGSGVIVSPEGYMVTNYHVVEGAQRVWVQFSDGRELEAQFLDAEPNLDIAVLRVNVPQGEAVPYTQFGDSDALEVGDVVLAMGNPFGVGQSVSMGIVSAVGRTNVGVSHYENFIQTDAAINPGNSGGPLIDSTGAVIGINTAIFTRNGGSHGIGFATPANAVQMVLNSVTTTGKVSRPWFGASGQNLTSALANRLGLQTPQGVLVNELVQDSPAMRSGLKVGDIIKTLNRRPVTDLRSLNAHILTAPLNQPVDMRIWREGRERDLTVFLETLPERRAADQLHLEGDQPLTGYVVEQLSPALNHELQEALGRTGVVVMERPVRTAFFGLNLRRGDVLREINGRAINTLADVEAALQGRPRKWEMSYSRGGRVFRLVLQ